MESQDVCGPPVGQTVLNQLLVFSDMPAEFQKIATKTDRVRAVYHSHHRQLFAEINQQKYQLAAFREISMPAPIQLIPPMKLFVDYLKDRLSVGTIFSLPPGAFPGDLAIVPLGAAPEVFDGKNVVPTCLALAQKAPPVAPKIGRTFSMHRFFRVIKATLSGRFLQHDSSNKTACIGVMELQLGGREGDAAIFGHCGTTILHLNLDEIARVVGIELLLTQMTLWPQRISSMLDFQLPAAGASQPAMLAITACSAVGAGETLPWSGRSTKGWDRLVSCIMAIMSNPEGDGQCFFDAIEGQLRCVGVEGGVDICVQTLTDMMNAGVLFGKENEIGEHQITINHDSIKWKATSGVEMGDRALTSHVDGANPGQHPKLSLMMHLCSKGWTPMLADADKTDKAAYFSRGDKLLFLAMETRPKSYFIVLCLSEPILNRLAVSDETLPLIYHSMPDAYYRLLLRLEGRKRVQALQDLLGAAPNVKALSDKDFKELLPEEIEEPPDDDGWNLGLLAVKDMVPVIGSMLPIDKDIVQVHKMAKQVLSGVPASMVDFKSKWCRRFGPRDCSVHFDGFSHSSGRQRGWISCPHANHQACFKYVYVDSFESHRHCAAWLVEWSEHARAMPFVWTKYQHLAFRPALEEWQRHLDEMREVA